MDDYSDWIDLMDYLSDELDPIGDEFAEDCAAELMEKIEEMRGSRNK